MASQLKAFPPRFGRVHRSGDESGQDEPRLSVAIRADLWPAFPPTAPPATVRPEPELDVISRRDGLRPLVAEAIAHQMRATLGLISGYSQTVLHLPLEGDTRDRYLQRIALASDSLARLTDEMLEIASSPDRASVPSPGPVPLGGLFARVALELGGAIDSPVRVDVPDDLPLVEVDEIWIALVVRNLVTNAAKYARGSAIVLSACHREDVVVASVSDGGGGIDAEERRHIFEPAFRGRAAVESGSHGSGLGLYLCRQLVAAHGGRIWLEEGGLGGTVVSFTLPTGRPAAARPSRPRIPVFLETSRRAIRTVRHA